VVGDAAEADDGVAGFLLRGLGVESGDEAGGEAHGAQLGEVSASEFHHG